MRTDFSDVFGGRFFGALITGSVGLALVAEAALKLVERTFPSNTWYYFAIVGFVLLGIAGYQVQRWRGWMRRLQHEVDTGDPVTPAEVLVITASLGGTVPLAEAALAPHHDPNDPTRQLTRLYILHTSDERGREVFQQIRQRAEELGVPSQGIKNIPIAPQEVDNPGLIYGELRGIYEEVRELTTAEGRRLGADDVVLDFTGGTSSFSVATALLGAQSGRRLQYVHPRKRDDKGAPVLAEGSEATEVFLDFAVRNRQPS